MQAEEAASALACGSATRASTNHTPPTEAPPRPAAPRLQAPHTLSYLPPAGLKLQRLLHRVTFACWHPTHAGERGADGAGGPAGALHALPAGGARPRDDRRGRGVAAVGCVPGGAVRMVAPAPPAMVRASESPVWHRAVPPSLLSCATVPVCSWPTHLVIPLCNPLPARCTRSLGAGCGMLPPAWLSNPTAHGRADAAALHAHLLSCRPAGGGEPHARPERHPAPLLVGHQGPVRSGPWRARRRTGTGACGAWGAWGVGGGARPESGVETSG